MANQEHVIGYAEFPAGFLANDWVETELLQFNGVGNHREVSVSAEQPFSGVFTACETFCRVKVRERTQCELHQVLGKLTLAHRGM